MPDENSNGWSQWSRHVLAEIQRLDKMDGKVTADLYALDCRLEAKLAIIDGKIVVIQTTAAKSGAIVGAIAGGITAVIVAIALALIMRALGL